jgi:hypothetical protein
MTTLRSLGGFEQTLLLVEPHGAQRARRESSHVTGRQQAVAAAPRAVTVFRTQLDVILL